MALGLGAFLLAVAGFFAYYGFGFLALAELFVYVGGVLVLVLFAIMLVHADGERCARARSRASTVLRSWPRLPRSVLLFVMVRPLAARLRVASGRRHDRWRCPTRCSGRLLPQFEAVGAAAARLARRRRRRRWAVTADEPDRWSRARSSGSGCYGVLVRRDIVAVLASVEVMLGGALVLLVGLGASRQAR